MVRTRNSSDNEVFTSSAAVSGANDEPKAGGETAFLFLVVYAILIHILALIGAVAIAPYIF